MNPQFEVLGIARTPMSSEEFRKKSGEAAAKSKDTRGFSKSGWEDTDGPASWHELLKIRGNGTEHAIGHCD